MTAALHLVAILLTAISMSAGWAHLLELPNKMPLGREDYLTVQQIYRGWALLGVAVIGALVTSAALALRLRGRGEPYGWPLAAAFLIAASLAVFFTFTFPVNQATENWTALPVTGWEGLRRRWEYSHAINAWLYLMALGALSMSAIVQRNE